MLQDYYEKVTRGNLFTAPSLCCSLEGVKLGNVLRTGVTGA